MISLTEIDSQVEKMIILENIESSIDAAKIREIIVKNV
jgi:ABC-type enterochelin transport system ATPase subunit